MEHTAHGYWLEEAGAVDAAPPLAGDISADVVVIGAGVIGAATALALARGGRKVLSLDKLPAAGYGSTSGSCAIIRPFYSTLDGSALAYESHFYWKEWAEFLSGHGVGLFDSRGQLKLALGKYAEYRAAGPAERRFAATTGGRHMRVLALF